MFNVVLPRAKVLRAYCLVYIPSLMTVAPHADHLEVPFCDLREAEKLFEKLGMDLSFGAGSIGPSKLHISTLALPVQHMTDQDLACIPRLHTVRELMLYSSTGACNYLRCAFQYGPKLSIVAIYLQGGNVDPAVAEMVFNLHAKSLHKFEVTTTTPEPFLKLEEENGVVLGYNREESMMKPFTMRLHPVVTVDIMVKWRAL